MISGISRLSIRQVFFKTSVLNLIKRLRRSITATATFLTTGVFTAQILHGELPAVDDTDWTLGRHGKTLLAFQAVPLAISMLLYFLVCDLRLTSMYEYLTVIL